MGIPSLVSEPIENPESHESQYVHDVYNEIAPHFSSTRYKPWPIVEKFLGLQADYSIGLDVGCGNGKYLGVNKKLFILGLDHSDGLVKCAQTNSDNRFNLCVADGLHLPHHNDRFDFAISIAVIHHFLSSERRMRAISHILSKLRVGGRALIYCWALEQENSRRGYKAGDSQDMLIPWVLQAKKSKSAEEPEKPAETKYRYYHLYKEGELVDNAEQAGGIVVESGYEKDNWWVVVEKK